MHQMAVHQTVLKLLCNNAQSLQSPVLICSQPNASEGRKTHREAAVTLANQCITAKVRLVITMAASCKFNFAGMLSACRFASRPTS